MYNLVIPKNYKSDLNLLETQKAIKLIKDFFESRLASTLNLTRVSAPLFVESNLGINDNLTGVEKPVSFYVNQECGKTQLEIVQSLAKWKRNALKEYNIPIGSGIYADMNAIRASETCDNTHSYYVDQWDWEKTIDDKDRTEIFLIQTVRTIYQVLLDTQVMLKKHYPKYNPVLRDTISIVTSQDLENKYPSLSPEEREKQYCKKYGSMFLMKIGNKLNSGKPHDVRSPDYDDWNLNGDIIVWNPILNDALELSSMGIRVNSEVLKKQLEISDNLNRLNFEFHKNLIANNYPQAIGGGIGQSRLCMLFLQKAHIGEVQASAWPKEMIEECKKNNINLL
ncbi:aspartate--ammonia ligase [Miniphocaeibacter halophilus]|uniref:Aspartate--ammonia ligase n=1 Tax=Miniphocaeibacter halophilus TaxID=2931922 RepID=A0AC61MTE6_9FIRM|nr:aspartate--ammonia ligase [Miniphocaeibacter halophilus]QQK07578.1 aspartate--ammonia ligase [Miniphocaeibacter halophilus]